MHKRSALKQLLEDHTAADSTEAGHRLRMLDLLAGPQDPWSRSSCRPGHFTASTFVLDPSGDRLLLILHRTLGLWLQPGGHFEPDDADLEAAARREVLEETGVQDLNFMPRFPGLFDLDIHSIPANPKRDEPAHEHFDLRLAFQAGSNDIVVTEDVADARWVLLDKVSECGSDESVLRAVRKLIGGKQSFSGKLHLL